MKKTLYLLLLLFVGNNAFAQKNEASIYYSYIPDDSPSKANSVGVRYAREVFPKLSIMLGFDHGESRYSLNHSSKLSVYNLATGVLLFQKSVDLDYDTKIGLNNIDLLVYYNVLKERSKFNLSPFLGFTQRIYNITNIPFLEIYNYEILNQTEVKETKNYTLPKVGLSCAYKLSTRWNVGAEFFYRTYTGNKSKVLFTNTSKSTSVAGTVIYDDMGRSTVLSEGSGSGYGFVEFYEEIGFVVKVAYRF